MLETKEVHGENMKNSERKNMWVILSQQVKTPEKLLEIERPDVMQYSQRSGQFLSIFH